MTKNIDEMFDHYLKLVKLNKDELSKIQLQETKRAFYGGVGHIIKFIGNSPKSNLFDDVLNLRNQVSDFWKNETEKK